jgi:hypothetical protein
MGEVHACGLCGGHLLDVILDMGSQPLAENFTCKDTFPLVLLRCRECTLVQLSYQVDPGLLFPADHPYRTGHSPMLLEHYQRLVGKLAKLAGRPPYVAVDIGCNDGSLLDNYTYDVTTVGVEPTSAGRAAAAKNHTWIQASWTLKTAETIREKSGPAKIITANNVLAHVPDPHGFLRAVRILLAHDGIFVTENGDASKISGPSLQIDTVYHEHLRYYTMATMARLLAKNGFAVTNMQRIATHGGSFRTWAARDTGHMTVPLAERATGAATALRLLLGEYLDQGKLIWGVAATTRATPLIHFTGTAAFIEKISEPAGSRKIGHTLPGTRIPIVDEAELIAAQPAAVVLFAWHIKDHIVPGLRERGYKGDIIVPLPTPEVLPV